MDADVAYILGIKVQRATDVFFLCQLNHRFFITTFDNTLPDVIPTLKFVVSGKFHLCMMFVMWSLRYFHHDSKIIESYVGIAYLVSWKMPSMGHFYITMLVHGFTFAR